MSEFKKAKTPRSLPKTLLSWITTARLSLIMFVIGGLFFLVFFLHIGFMPDVNISDSTGLLLAISIVGMLLILSFVLMVVLPGLTVPYFLKEGKIKLGKATAAIVFVPNAAFLGAAIYIAYAGCEAWLSLNELFWAYVATLLLVSLLGPRWLKGATKEVESSSASTSVRAKTSARGDYIGRAAMLFLACWTWLLGIVVPFLIASSMVTDARLDDSTAWTVVVGWLLMCAVFNMILTMHEIENQVVIAVVFGIFLLLALMFASTNFASMSVYAMRKLGLGELEHVDLVVKKEACSALKLASSTALRCTEHSDAGLGIIRDGRLVSRVGAQYLIAPANGHGRAMVPKDAVVMLLQRTSADAKQSRASTASCKKQA